MKHEIFMSRLGLLSQSRRWVVPARFENGIVLGGMAQNLLSTLGLTIMVYTFN